MSLFTCQYLVYRALHLGEEFRKLRLNRTLVTYLGVKGMAAVSGRPVVGLLLFGKVVIENSEGCVCA